MRRRVRIELDGGHMDVHLDDDASPETVEALKALGQAAVTRMAAEQAAADAAAGSLPRADGKDPVG